MRRIAPWSSSAVRGHVRRRRVQGDGCRQRPPRLSGRAGSPHEPGGRNQVGPAPADTRQVILLAGPTPSTPPLTPSPSPAEPKIELGHVLGSVVHGIWIEVTSSGWSAAAAIVFIVAVCVRTVRAVAYPRWRRDPVRLFSRRDKAEILRRAGGRCEHHSWVGGRCELTDGLEADHIIPWSRSGRTVVGNGQALCRRHNRAKRARVPFRWQLTAMARRRGAYFPAGVSGQVSRRRRAPSVDLEL
jgi:hypothetical protein